jgi:hypothetical protein
VCPRRLIEEVLAETGKASQRERLLPAPAVVYYVMALALCYLAPLWSHLDRGLMEPHESRANGAREIAG